MGIDTTKAINVGAFTSGQKQFLDFHRNAMLRNLSAASTRGRTAARNHPNREQHSKDVRSGSHNRLKSDIARCPFCAMCGRLRVGKDFLHERSIGRCSHVFGLT